MYNEKYIRDFDEKLYEQFLKNPQALKELGEAYVNQYSNPTYECTIAFKESLDHYVLKQIEGNGLAPELLKNYYDHIYRIYNNRVSKGNLHLEYNTNAVFKSSIGQKYLLSYYERYHPEVNRAQLLQAIKNNVLVLKNISDKMHKNQDVSQTEMDLLADYLYTKRYLDSKTHEKFVEYLLNKNVKLKNSPEIMGAYIAYLPKIFGDKCENSRAILSNGIFNRAGEIVLPSEIDKNRGTDLAEYWSLYSIGDRYISIDWNVVKNLLFNSDKSLDISRASFSGLEKEEHNDLYWITMVCFHEMTHQLQNYLTASNKMNSSGLSMIVKMAKHERTDNTYNHDSIESEIEADENSWDKMRKFIFKYRLNSDLCTDKEAVKKQLKKCDVNKEAVYARRAILTKYGSNDNFFASDMQLIQNKFNNSNVEERKKYREYFRNLRSRFPMMQKIFDEQGQIRPTLLLEENITSEDFGGLKNNIMSSEVSKYILTEEYDSLKKQVMQGNLSETQVQNLMINIYNTYHLDKMYVRALSGVDFEQYKHTRTNFDLQNVRSKYMEKFRDVADLVYKERELVHIINNRYPEYDVEQYAAPKYAVWNYNDMFGYLYNSSKGIVGENEVSDIIRKYQATGDKVLVGIANQTKKAVMPNQMSGNANMTGQKFA